jgi:putative hydrolase of the HAD superfamily
MKRTALVTTLFLDVGDVLLTDGWDHLARRRAAKHFKLAWTDMEERHALVFETHEEGRMTFQEYLGWVVSKAAIHAGSVPGLHLCAVEAVPRDD